MKQIVTCNLARSAISYDIEVGRGLLTEQGPFLTSLGSRIAIISDVSVGRLYGQRLLDALRDDGFDCELFTFCGGEENKTRATKERLENEMLKKGFGRDTCIVALGGGIVTDVAGFVAATYCRGVPLVMMPTSLLAMVDASIGGKTGVNAPQGKNLIGSIHQPCKVVIDTQTLATLPKQEVSNGLVEMIKHGLIADSSYFEFLEQHLKALLTLNANAIQTAIIESCRIKRDIVQQDETEQGIRRTLNFGHTIGHALEHASHHALSHGEAVAIGLIVEASIATEFGLDISIRDRIERLIEKLNMNLHIVGDCEEIIAATLLDKKAIKQHARYVILKEIGACKPCNGNYCMPVDDNIINISLETMCNKLLTKN